MPYLSLALFCGLRPKELERLNWDDIALDEKLVTIRGAAAKLRERRIVELTDNVSEWLREHHGQHAIVGENFRRDFDAVRRLSGFKGSVYRKKCDAVLKPWPADVLRHVAISYWQAKFKDEGKCADRHGNSVEVIHRHYRGLVRAGRRSFLATHTRQRAGRVASTTGSVSEIESVHRDDLGEAQTQRRQAHRDLTVHRCRMASATSSGLK